MGCRETGCGPTAAASNADAGSAAAAPTAAKIERLVKFRTRALRRYRSESGLELQPGAGEGQHFSWTVVPLQLEAIAHRQRWIDQDNVPDRRLEECCGGASEARANIGAERAWDNIVHHAYDSGTPR